MAAVAQMSRMDSLVARVRMELGDQVSTFLETSAMHGDTARLTLNYAPMDAPSVQVWVDGVDMTPHVSVEEASGTIIFDAVPEPDSVVTVAGRHFRFFTDDELAKICADAVGLHTHGKTDLHGRALNLERMTESEMYPVSLLATVQALYILATDASFDIDIMAPDGMSVPRSERYRQLMENIQLIKGRYEELCALMGIGMYSIDVFTMRRISKRTNRYVPVYRPQEIDDRSRPKRVRLPIPTYGAAVQDDGIPDLDLTIYRGDTFSALVEIVDPLPAEATVAAQIRSYPGSNIVLADFTIRRVTHDFDPADFDTVDFATGTRGQDDPDTATSTFFRLVLTSEQTQYLPRECVWDLQVVRTLADGTDDVKTYLNGAVFAPEDVTRQRTSSTYVDSLTTLVDKPANIGYQQNQNGWVIP